MHYQRTVKEEVSCTGIGLHSGKRVKMTIKPAKENEGISFIRKYKRKKYKIKGDYSNILNGKFATVLGVNGVKISTVEHLLAAFFGLGVDNAIVELDADEVPAMDGSATSFVYLIKSAGIVKQKAFKKFFLIKKPFTLKEGERSVAIYPHNSFAISYTIDFNHPLINNQSYDFIFSEFSFEREIAPARTFGMLKEVEFLWKNGFAKGGSLDNAIVIDEFRILNEGGLRFKDEFVRHKILDMIGDLSLLRHPIIGKVVAHKSGHALNHKVINQLLSRQDCYEIVEIKEEKELERLNITFPDLTQLKPAFI
ncbi:MAG: UDP-3-O-acyl-N-acetylglucosamine deacetylase [Deltaproteobacteria bacterium]|nr:UDP-3-O-acyl-N-acetylglucosamine deacetylase [Deltaproteobacteria bacterium]